MRDEPVIPLLGELPTNATNGEALAWVKRARRIIDRWDTLPGYGQRSMTPELKRQAHAELDEMEHGIRSNMSLPEGA